MAEVFPRRIALLNNQSNQLQALLAAILPANAFYLRKLEAAGARRRIANVAQFQQFPFTYKHELMQDQHEHPPYGTNLTFPLDRYVRCHQTSGTSGTPLRWLDTAESWNWMLGNWEQVLRVASVTRNDRVLCAFSFGPFLGFWLAYEAALRLGCLCVPGGGLSSAARLRVILDQGISVLCCTPTYGIHLAEVAARERIDLSASTVRVMIVAGEPGGSVAATRQRLSELWPGLRVFDHHGMTETGPVSFECPVRAGVLHIMESAFIPEVISPSTGAAAAPGDVGELVLTTLGRTASPLLRYRTGDMVKPSTESICECGRSDLALEGGILGRTDDMVVIRGVNIYPTAVEQIIRGVPEIAEYAVTVDETKPLTELMMRIEPEPKCADADQLARALQSKFEAALSLRVPVTVVPPGSLPRYELKAKRWTKVKSP
ncbi:MAG TPA: AMP-binding protein [Verrucomicrobiae bacterium]|nr:AMP-binding protein [Verrucomicrobiae bacterium]